MVQAGASPANGTFILGNLIGTNSSGLAPLANGGAGIDVDGASNTQIGMPGGGYGNVVSGNLGAGIDLSGGTTGTVIVNNLVGIALNGTAPIGNGGDGILIDGAQGQGLVAPIRTKEM